MPFYVSDMWGYKDSHSAYIYCLIIFFAKFYDSHFTFKETEIKRVG